MNIIKFKQIDDETIDIFCNDKFICQLNHDDDGWVGMDRIERIIKRIAEIIGAEVVNE